MSEWMAPAVMILGGIFEVYCIAKEKYKKMQYLKYLKKQKNKTGPSLPPVR